jgi:hypothetical protein
MGDIMHRTLGGLAAAALLLAASLASGATDDHLDCVRVKDPNAFKAQIDLATRFGVKSNCNLKVKSTLLCTPATKSLLTSTAPALAFDGQTMSDAKLCYKLTCTKEEAPNATVFDQFGERPMGGERAKLVCTPAAVF